MPVRYWIAASLGLFAILGWNAFLIQRDNKLFKAYDNIQHAKVCEQVKSFHPDCQR